MTCQPETFIEYVLNWLEAPRRFIRAYDKREYAVTLGYKRVLPCPADNLEREI